MLTKHPIVFCSFWDHVSGSSPLVAPMLCEIWGVLWKEDKTAYYITSWVAEQNLESENSETYCVLKSAVIDLIQLKKGRTLDSRKAKRRFNRSKRVLP